MDYEIEVRAGPENKEVYRYVSSPIPEGIKSVDDPFYKQLSKSALETASNIVKITGKNIKLKLLIEGR